jgi:sugar-specific transcriptional regulator TrmB
MPDFLEEKKREIDERLKELRPLVDEFQRLEAAAAALQGVGASTSNSRASTPAARRTRRRSASSRSSSSSSSTGTGTGTGRRGRPRGSGTRSKQALELVRTRPGITIPEIAEAIGIQQNYLYRVLPSLQKDGLVRKEGRGWHPREAA